MRGILVVLLFFVWSCDRGSPTDPPSWCSLEEGDVLLGQWEGQRQRSGLLYTQVLTIEEGESPCVYIFTNRMISPDSLHTYESEGVLLVVSADATAGLFRLNIESRSDRWIQIDHDRDVDLIGADTTIYDPFLARVWDDTLLLWGLHFYRLA